MPVERGRKLVVSKWMQYRSPHQIGQALAKLNEILNRPRQPEEEKIQSIRDWSAYFDLLDATAMLELAIWGRNIDDIGMNAKARQAIRRDCGSDMNIIVPGVLQFVDVSTLGSTEGNQQPIREVMAERFGGIGEEDEGDSEANGDEDGGKNRSGGGSGDESRPSAFEQEILSMDIPDEPAADAGTARVQIRMPDGSRFVRRFVGDDPVKTIYALVVQSNEEATDGRAFELRSFGGDLLESAGNSVSDTGLDGEDINVNWK